MPAYLIYGDSFLVAQALKELQKQVGPPEVVEANMHRVSGGQTDPGQLKALCSAVPFLAERRLVVLEGLLSTFGTRERRRRPSTSGSRASTGDPRRGNLSIWEELPKYIGEEMPPTTLLVFLEDRVSGENPLLGKLRPLLQVQELTAPSGERLARWIRDRVAEKGARIAPGAIRLLSQYVGGSLWTMDSELEKLSLYARDRAIEEADVRLLVSQAREASIFGAVDALLEGRSAVALRSIHRLRNDGADFTYIIAMVARQLRLVTLAKDLIDRGHGQREIGERLGLTLEFALRRTLEQARKHSWAGLVWLYGRLLEADMAVKQGRLGQDVALELLVGEATSPQAVGGGHFRQSSSLPSNQL